jgi:hypothetical protein
LKAEKEVFAAGAVRKLDSPPFQFVEGVTGRLPTYSNSTAVIDASA